MQKPRTKKLRRFIKILPHTANNENQNLKPWIVPRLEDACTPKQKELYEFVKTPSPKNKGKYDKLQLFVKSYQCR